MTVSFALLAMVTALAVIGTAGTSFAVLEPGVPLSPLVACTGVHSTDTDLSYYADDNSGAASPSLSGVFDAPISAFGDMSDHIFYTLPRSDLHADSRCAGPSTPITIGDSPTVEIAAAVTVIPIRTGLALTATATDPEDGDLDAAITWSSVPAGLTGTGSTITWTPTAAGTYEITAMITDDDGNYARDTHRVTVDNGMRPTVSISSTVANTIQVNSQITLTATATDPEDGDLDAAITWSSVPAGLTGTGSTITWTPSQPGAYEITAMITDSDGNYVRDTHTVMVDRGMPPRVEITTTDDTIQVNSQITLTATATDPEDGDLDADITWVSDPAGLTGTGATVIWTPTATGIYNITATITDSDGNYVKNTHRVTVDNGMRPTVSISSTVANTIQVNSQIALTATATDPEDGDLDADITWSSVPAGLTGTGDTVIWTPTATGIYNITATITDSDMNSIYDTHTVTVQRDDPPTIMISTTVPNTTQVNSQITLTATATDPEEGDIGADITWISDPAGVTGTGSTITWTPIATGTYEITATITDSTGNYVRDTHTVMVDRGMPPSVEITTATDTVQVNSQITLTATATDPEDGDIGADITWISDPAGVTGAGDTTTWTPSEPGIYEIAVFVVDNQGNSDRDVHTITVERNDPPRIEITTTTADTVQVNSQITLTATATDPEDGDIGADVEWTSRPDGLSGMGPLITWTPQNAGIFVIMATITDRDGNSVEDMHTVNVTVAPGEQIRVKNPLYQQPPESSQSFATKIILAHDDPITSNQTFSSSIRAAMDVSIMMWEKSNSQQLDFHIQSRPLDSNAGYEYDTQPVSIVNLYFEDYLPDDRVGYYTTEYYEYGDGTIEFISHDIYVQLGWNDCRGNYQQFDDAFISDILEHEIGHYLQLGHTLEKEHLMYSPYDDAVSPDEFDELGWNIPPDTTYNAPKTAVGVVLDQRLDELKAEYSDLVESLDSNLPVDVYNQRVDQINENVGIQTLLVPEYNCVESP